MSKVLIIDDKRDNIIFVANNILKPLGYEIITARDGQSGLEKAQEERPDLIISDLKLPKLGGLDMLEQLVEKGIDIPTIVMTFHGSEATAIRAFRLGVRDYLIKPFTVEEIHEALDRALKPQPKDAAAQAKIAELEDKLAQMQTLLVERENRLKQIQEQLVDYVKKSDMVEVAQRAIEWEEESARLNEALAQTKDMVDKAERRVESLEEIMIGQKVEIEKYRQEAKKLTDQLCNLSEASRTLFQGLTGQVERLEILVSQRKEE